MAHDHRHPMHYLAENAGETVALRDEVYDRAIDVQVGRLSKELRPEGAREELIRTEWGARYVFTSAVETVR